jgi:hypothetical protein
MSQVKRNLVAVVELAAEVVLLPFLVVGALAICAVAAVQRRFANWLGGGHGHF